MRILIHCIAVFELRSNIMGLKVSSSPRVVIILGFVGSIVIFISNLHVLSQGLRKADARRTLLQSHAHECRKKDTPVRTAHPKL